MKRDQTYERQWQDVLEGEREKSASSTKIEKTTSIPTQLEATHEKSKSFFSLPFFL